MVLQSASEEHSTEHVAPTHVRPPEQPRRVWQQCVGSAPHAAVPGPGIEEHPSVYSLSHCAPNAPPSLPPPTELSIVDGPGASPPASEGPPRSAGVPELPPQPSKKKMKASAATRNMSTSGRLSIIVLRLGRYQGFPTPPTRTPDPGPVLFGIGVALLIRADSPKWAGLPIPRVRRYPLLGRALAAALPGGLTYTTVLWDASILRPMDDDTPRCQTSHRRGRR
jgi:hypothetical protein